MQHSRHDFTLFALPDRMWRWRMKGGAAEIMQDIRDLAAFDAVFVTSLCNVAELKALAGPSCPPIVLYAHENQLTYPKGPYQKRDLQTEWIDFMNTVTADRVVYNANVHRERYHEALQVFLEEMPRATLAPAYWLQRGRDRSMVLHPGTDTPDAMSRRCASSSGRPCILWNHRWEHDKHPVLFLKTLLRCMEAGYAFDVILLGESPPASKEKYQPLIAQLGDRVIHQGYAESRNTYFSLLASADIVISTARQENFGLSVVEAIQCGCFPLLPHRLSYPEVIPSAYHADVLYATDQDLFPRLTVLLDQKGYRNKEVCRHLIKHRWEHCIDAYDALFRELVAS